MLSETMRAKAHRIQVWGSDSVFTSAFFEGLKFFSSKFLFDFPVLY